MNIDNYLEKIPIYPFTAIVGQTEMKIALILNLIDPNISGVLIRGERGTAKSTAVRGLSALLPKIKVVKGCPFNCNPENRIEMCPECKNREDLSFEYRAVRVVELPIGATEDRVLGTIDIESAIREGIRRFEPGVLAAANRNILYVDEVNLLDDHLVDVLLDAAAMGVNTVERESISYTHPSRFTLVGTMNPEEGELRPQLLDRFGLCVKVESLKSNEEREELIKRRLAFERDPVDFLETWEAKNKSLANQIEMAKNRLNGIKIDDEVFRKVVELTLEIGIDGHRGDLTILKAARALAAFRGKDEIEEIDIKYAAHLSLPHRIKRKPFEELQFDIFGEVKHPLLHSQLF